MAEVTGNGPVVVACLRHTDLRPEVDGLTGHVGLDVRAETTSAADQAALELALTFTAARGGRAVAVVAGPSAVEDTLRQAVAAGADALRVPWSAEPGGADWLADVAGDEQGLARALASAIRTLTGGGPPDLVICGDRSPDRGTGALPAFLAAELGAAQALGLVSLTLGRDLGAGDLGAGGIPGGGISGGSIPGGRTSGGDPWGGPQPDFRGERRLDGGRRERLAIPAPAVCSVEAAGLRLRRASLPATLAAARVVIPVAPVDPTPRVAGGTPAGRPAPVRIGTAAPFRPRTKVMPAPAGAGAHERLLQLTGALVAHEPPTIVGPTDAGAATDALLDYLDRHGYLPDAAGPVSPPSPPS